MEIKSIRYRCTDEELEKYRNNLEALKSPDGMFPFLRDMGGRLDWIRGVQAQGTLAVSKKDGNRNPFGILSGGAIDTLCDIIGGYTALQPGVDSFTVCSNLNYLQPAEGEKVVCLATLLRLSHYRATVEMRVSDENDCLIASGTFQYALVKTRRA